MSLFEEVHEPPTADVPTRRVTVTVTRRFSIETPYAATATLDVSARVTNVWTTCRL